MTLKTQFAIAIGGLIATFSLLFTIWTIRQVSIQERANVIQSQRALLHATSTDLEEKIELRKDAIATIGRLFPEEILDSPTQIASFFEPRPVLRKIFDAVVIVDNAGRVKYLDSSASPPFDPRVSSGPFLDEVLKSDGVLISRIQGLTPGTDEFIGFAVPLRSKNGATLGALVGTLKINYHNFLGELSQVRIGREGYFSLLDERQDPQFIVDGQNGRVGKPAPGGTKNLIIQDSLAGHEGYVEGLNTLGIPTLRSYMPLTSAPWLLVAVYPTDEAFAGVRTRTRQVIEIGSSLFLLGSIVAWWMTHWLLRPLTRLREEIESDRSQSDSGNLLSYGSAEIVALAHAYHTQSSRRSLIEDQLRTSQRRLQSITDNLPALIAHVDAEWRYTFANAQYQRMFGTDPREMIGKTIREVRGDALHNATATQMSRALNGEVVTFERCDNVDGKEYFLRSEFIPDIDDANQVVGVYVLSIDISPLKAAQAIQLATEERLRAITDNVPGLIAYIDHNSIVQFANRTFYDWYGLLASDVVGHHCRVLFGEDEYHSNQQNYIDRCLGGERVSFRWQTQTKLGKRVLQLVYIPNHSEGGIVKGFYALGTDVTELKQKQSRLENLVRRDALTGVANRYHFTEQLPIVMQRCQENGMGMAVAFLDLDHFKSINDQFGHATGDQVLKEFAQRLLEVTRTSDLVARLAGDEFVIVLEGLSSRTDAETIAAKIVQAIAAPMSISGIGISITTSVGLAYERPPVSPPKDLLANADAALYLAKDAGRNTHIVFTP